MRTRLAAVALLGSLALSPTERIEFDPAPGTSVRKRFETELELSFDRLLQLRSSDLIRWIIVKRSLVSLEVRTSAVLDVADRYRECSDGRPILLERTYEQLVARARSRTRQENDLIIDLGFDVERELDVDAIEGVTVTFAWDDSTSAYRRTLEEGEDLDIHVLETLTEDLDLRALLPEQPATSARRWRVPWSRLGPVALPGLLGQNVAAPKGLLPWVPDDLSAAIGRAFADQYATCTLMGTRAVGADECAVVHFHSAPRGDIDLKARTEETNAWGLWSITLSADAEISAELYGEWLWSLERQHFRSLEIEGDVALEGTFSLRVDGPYGICEEAVFNAKLSGDVRWSARAD